MMYKILKVFGIVLLVSAGFISAPAYESMVGPTGVLKYDAEKSYGRNLDSILALADRAMYQAKQRGKNSIVAATPPGEGVRG